MERRSEPLLTIQITLGSLEEAKRVYEALRVDDDEFITTSLQGAILIAHITGPNVGSVRRAADDWMACLISATNTIK